MLEAFKNVAGSLRLAFMLIVKGQHKRPKIPYDEFLKGWYTLPLAERFLWSAIFVVCFVILGLEIMWIAREIG